MKLPRPTSDGGGIKNKTGHTVGKVSFLRPGTKSELGKRQIDQINLWFWTCPSTFLGLSFLCLYLQCAGLQHLEIYTPMKFNCQAMRV